MSFDLTGIENINEFYSHHYLNAILEDDLKDLFKNWKEKEEKESQKAPYSLISGMSGLYFRRKDNFLKARSQEEKIEISRQFYAELMYPIGYELKPDIKELEGNEVIPVLGEVKKSNDKTDIWFIETITDEDTEFDPFKAVITENQLDGKMEPGREIPEEEWEEIISKKIFTLDEPPRWIILINMDNIFLIDRSKWGQKKWLKFDMSDIFGRKELSTIKAFSALLHRDNISPSEGICFLDTLDENSHKHAFSVSEDLKFGIRRAVELIGNEYIYYNREKLHGKMYNEDLARDLTTESLRFLYRLLFIFYIEARPELEFAPMKSQEYRKGYSLETLRDLELVPLNSDEARNGYYIDSSLKKLFELIYNGFGKKPEQMELGHDVETEIKTFSFHPLKSHLFDPASMILLNKIKFRNFILQEIIRLLSLSKEEKRKTRGRISYAQLGINQLGAVYEGLLSYTGFFAEEDLYQVAEEGKNPDDIKEQAYFIKESELNKYEDREKVYEKDGSLRCYPRGTFIYRLAGRDREKSASYYTPEVLTSCVVKYARKELLKDKSADDILNITVCEPALGSGSFLNETLNQLSEAYLSLKQKETGQMIDHDRYAMEKQKVKAFIAANNIYGVDLNEIAAELAEVSIWLNTIYPDEPVPWLKMNFATGNSLVGARRDFFDGHDIKNTEWLSKVPEHIELSETRG
ncbi:MAG: DNA methyltransferase, partial [Candidatus Eremiobacterota bacterium]